MSPNTPAHNQPAKLSYTLEEFCEATGLARTALYMAIKKGELTTFKNGRRRYVSAAAAAIWLSWLESGNTVRRKRT